MCNTCFFIYHFFSIFFHFLSNSLYFIIIIEENYNDVFKFMYTYQSHLALEKLLDLIYQFFFICFFFFQIFHFHLHHMPYSTCYLLYFLKYLEIEAHSPWDYLVINYKIILYFLVLNIIHFMPTVSFFRNFKSFSQMWILKFKIQIILNLLFPFSILYLLMIYEFEVLQCFGNPKI